MTIPVFIPLLRDSFRAEDSFKDWGHQALIPFVGGSIIEFILKDIAYASKQSGIKTSITLISQREKEDKFREVSEKIETILNDLDSTQDKSTKIEVKSSAKYRYIQDLVRILVNVIEEYSKEKEHQENYPVYMVHYPSVVLQNEIYIEFLKLIEELNTEEPSVLLVLFPIMEEMTNGRDVLFSDEIKVKDIVPRTNIQVGSSLSVKKGTKKDYVLFDYNGGSYTAEMIGVFAFNKRFLEMLEKGGNINLTSENRFQDILKYLHATHDVKILALAIGSGRFVSLKYPWQILRGFDFISRFLLYRLIKEGSSEYISLILKDSPEEIWKGVCVTERRTSRPSNIGFKDLDFKKLGPKKNLERPRYGYAFEDYPLEEETDPVERYLSENGYSGVVFIKLPTTDKKSPAEVLHTIAEDPNTTLIKGIIFMEPSKTKISAGAHVRSSYIGEGSKILGQAIVDHSIIGKNTVLYPNSVIPYAIVGNSVVIGGQVTFAREKARMIGETVKRPPMFYTGKEIIRYEGRFSTLVGDRTKIMMGVDISPGCRIGYECEIFPNISVIYNVPPRTRVRYEGIFERGRAES